MKYIYLILILLLVAGCNNNIDRTNSNLLIYNEQSIKSSNPTVLKQCLYEENALEDLFGITTDNVTIVEGECLICNPWNTPKVALLNFKVKDKNNDEYWLYYNTTCPRRSMPTIDYCMKSHKDGLLLQTIKNHMSIRYPWSLNDEVKTHFLEGKFDNLEKKVFSTCLRYNPDKYYDSPEFQRMSINNINFLK